MKLEEIKISEYADNIKDLPNYPSDGGITAEQLKEIFDGRGDKEIKTAINGIIDELTSNTAAGQIKAADGKSVEEKFSEHAYNISELSYGISEVRQMQSEDNQRLSGCIENKVSKEEGKGLSSNDFTDEDKNTVAGAREHIASKNNPHNVTAEQIECSDGKTVEEALSEKTSGRDILTSTFTDTEKETVCENIGACTKEDFHAHIVDYTVDYDNLAKKDREFEASIGNIDAALDEIISMQEALTEGKVKNELKLVDRSTNKTYNLYVSDEKVMLEESEG